MYRILILFTALFIISCSTQRKLQKTYIGKPISAVESEFGKAKTVFEIENGKEYIFEKVEHLKSAEISQHKLTLDPMVTPQAIKTIRYFVTVVDGAITKINIEEEYERK